MKKLSKVVGGRSFATKLALVATVAVAGLAPALEASAGAYAPSVNAPTNLTVVEANGTVTATWTPGSMVYQSASRTATARWPRTLSMTTTNVVFTCTLLNGYGVSTSFTSQTTGNSCSFSGLNPATEYGVQLATSAYFTSDGSTYMSSLVPESAFPYGFSAPTTTVVVKHTPPMKHVIVCVKGKIVRHYAAVHPVCPPGFKIRH